jgi:hypothetical protein
MPAETLSFTLNITGLSQLPSVVVRSSVLHVPTANPWDHIPLPPRAIIVIGKWVVHYKDTRMMTPLIGFYIMPTSFTCFLSTPWIDYDEKPSSSL